MEIPETCKKCGLYKKCKSPWMPVSTPVGWTGKLLVVGEAPGEEEDRLGEPFVGPAGKLLRKLLRRAGWKRRDVAFTNAIICRPKANRTPTAAELRFCRHFLLDSINRLAPEKILGVGLSAAKTLRDRMVGKMAKLRGHEVEIAGRKALLTYHPSAVLHGSYWVEKLLLDDLKRLLKAKAYEPISAGSPRGDLIAVDVEWASDGRFLLAAVSDGKRASSDPEKVAEALASAKTLVGHSPWRDLDHLLRQGLPVKSCWLRGERIVDTVISSRMLDENLPSYALEELGLDLGLGNWKSATQSQIDRAELIDPALLAERCRADAAAAARLALDHRRRLDVSPELFSFTHRTAAVLHRVELAGAKIDLEKAAELGRTWMAEATKYSELLRARALGCGLRQFDPNKAADVRKLLYQKLGLPVLQRTAKEKLPATDKRTLLMLRELHPDVEDIWLLLQHSHFRKLASTWGTVASLVDPMGLLHFHFNPLGAKTGRRSSSGGTNSQNWPSEARASIVSRWPGGKIVSLDYSRLEVVLAAWLAGEKKLLEIFVEGNGYLDLAREFLDKEVLEDSPEYRLVKALVLGIDYGMGPAKLADQLWQLGIRKKDKWEQRGFAAELISRYFRLFPGIQRYIRRQISQVRTKGFVVSLTGRVRHLPNSGPGAPGWGHICNQAVNFPIQSLAADVTAAALVEIERSILKAHGWSVEKFHRRLLDDPLDLPFSLIINEVHDEIVLDWHPQEKLDLNSNILLCERLKPLRELIGQVSIPLKLKANIADRWS